MASTRDSSGSSTPLPVVSVAIGQWAVAVAPVKIRTLLGSCVGVILFDRVARLGAIAHIVLPDSRGALEHPGKFADTAIPAMIAEIERKLAVKPAGRLVAKLAGGARMFATGDGSSTGGNSVLNVGQMNQEAAERVLAHSGFRSWHAIWAAPAVGT